MRTLSPRAAFIITWLIVSVAVGVGVLSNMFAPGASFEFDRDFGWSVFGLVVTAVFVLIFGIVVGIPVLRGLKRRKIDHRLDALAIAGLVAGTASNLLFVLLLGGSPIEEPMFVVAGAGGGLLSGILWWILADPNLGWDDA